MAQTNQNSDKEYLDLVDSRDQVIGRMLRSEIYSKGLKNYRVVNAFLVNSKNELWIPRRTAHKRIFPLCLDMSVGGHVESGESYVEALIRETKEELQINLEPHQYHQLGKLDPNIDSVSSFMTVYEIKTDQTPNYNSNDFVEYFWLTPKAFFKKLAEGEQTKDDLPKLIRHFYQV